MSRSRSEDERTQARLRWAESKLNHQFADPSLLTRALTHRSASRSNNERLEFLGDAVLNFCIARRLFDSRPEADEGDLSRGRAALVNKQTLARIARSMGLDDQLILGGGELRSGGAQRSAALADAVEALIGAVLLDDGFPAADALIGHLFDARVAALPAANLLKDPKTRLQEWLQQRGYELPAYSVDTVEGSDHERRFTVACAVRERGVEASGHGGSRRAAEQDAAARMLEGLAEDD